MGEGREREKGVRTQQGGKTPVLESMGKKSPAVVESNLARTSRPLTEQPPRLRRVARAPRAALARAPAPPHAPGAHKLDKPAARRKQVKAHAECARSSRSSNTRTEHKCCKETNNLG